MEALKKVWIGEEYDDFLIKKLKNILIKRDADISEILKGTGGSQEITQYTATINGIALVIDIKTYM